MQTILLSHKKLLSGRLSSIVCLQRRFSAETYNFVSRWKVAELGQTRFLTRWLELELWFKYRCIGGVSADILVYNKFCWREQFLSYEVFSIFIRNGWD